MKISLWNHDGDAYLETYPLSKKAPALVIVPGGGYEKVVDMEGAPIAARFNRLGFHCFTVRYRVFPHRWPEPVSDVHRALRIVLEHAEEWNISKTAMLGFSAGGHAACAAALLAEELDPDSPVRPDALLLAYPLITFGKYTHTGSREKLLGDRAGELSEQLSLENRVTESAPPAFLWHTSGDTVASPMNSKLFYEAMIKANRPCELHLFPRWNHGLKLADGTSGTPVTEDVSIWPILAVNFLKATCGFQF